MAVSSGLEHKISKRSAGASPRQEVKHLESIPGQMLNCLSAYSRIVLQASEDENYNSLLKSAQVKSFLSIKKLKQRSRCVEARRAVNPGVEARRAVNPGVEARRAVNPEGLNQRNAHRSCCSKVSIFSLI